MTDEKRLFRAIHSKKKEEPEETFNYIYVKYKPLVTFIVAKYIKNDADIEDIVQNSFIEFFNDVENLRSTIKSYLTVSCKHNALDFLKKNKKITLVDIDTLDCLLDENSFSEQKLLANEKYNCLVQELNGALSKEEAQIILFHLSDDLKFDDIALKLNRNVKTIKTKYYRAIKKFRKMKGVKQYEES